MKNVQVSLEKEIIDLTWMNKGLELKKKHYHIF